MNLNIMPQNCLLPSSPSCRCLDRFSILKDECEGQDGLVPTWTLVQTLLKSPITNASELTQLLDTISNTLRGTSGIAGDHATLKSFIERRHDSFFTHTWPTILRLALRLPDLFPSGELRALQPGDEVSLSGEQAGCLVAHMFLRTLEAPPWRCDDYDFGIWYAAPQRHEAAVEMYLSALTAYFSSLSQGQHETVVYALNSFAHSPLQAYQWEERPLCSTRTIRLDTYTTEPQEKSYQGPGGAVVVAANKNVGFGASATQEEVYAGNCPAACPAVLVTPTLHEGHVLVISGARPMLRIEGQRRDISWTELDGGIGAVGGTMLFMDALEMDMVEDVNGRLPDLEAGNLERELQKAYTAFLSLSHDIAAAARKSDDDENVPRGVVWTGFWGCGAFNGDPGTKMTLLWITASLAGVKELCILCDALNAPFARDWTTFVDRVVREGWTPRRLRDVLGEIPDGVGRGETMAWLLERSSAL